LICQNYLILLSEDTLRKKKGIGMNFCFVVNDAYVNHLVVLLTSIFTNNPGKHNMYVLTNGISSKSICLLQEYIVQNNSELHVIEVDDSCLDGVPLKRKDFNKTPYYKLLLPQELPCSIDRILYMDVDMVVKKDLLELYQTDFQGKYLAAVPDPLVNSRDMAYLQKFHVDLEAGDRYFNSGLILFNLTLFREKYRVSNALNYIKENGSTFKFHDQEVLNGLFLKEYIQLKEKYNYLTVFRGIRDMALYCFGMQKKISTKIYILHYANPTKPWKQNYIGKYEKEFWKYAEISPVYNELKANRRNSIIEQGKALAASIRRKMKR